MADERSVEIRVPAVGESVAEALVAIWYRLDGERVAKNEPLCAIETDKITLDIEAEAAGILRVTTPVGTTVPIGSVIGRIVTGETGDEGAGTGESRPKGRVSPSQRRAEREREGGREPAASAIPPSVRSEEEVSYGPGPTSGERVAGRTTRVPMTPIRKRIAERLLAARQQTAMLTTFNEADISRIRELRARYGEQFHQRHGVRLGMMPFFVKACCEALREFPAVNARIDGDDIVYQNFYDIGIAVAGEKGLVVPVLRDADRLHFAEIEKGIEEFGEKVKTNRLAISDLEGGTFSITNGGIFGSLLSTPILNPPQSGVLGMHAIQERPVAREGQVVIRPMMYLALTYDHRIVDGREAVQFLARVKEYVEQPEELLLEG